MDDELEKTEHDLEPNQEELREFYVTPFYVQTMSERVKDWSTEHIKTQMQLFRKTIPDYPEVLELLEGELHTRNLNILVRHMRKVSPAELQSLLKKYGAEPDYKELIEAELEIRGGAVRLYDSSLES